MAGFVEVALGDGGRLLLESMEDSSGPVKAGRAADAVEELRGGLQSILRPVVQASREVLVELRAAGPDEVTVEFGVKVTAGMGAVVARSTAGGHFKVTLGWTRDDGAESGSESGQS
ncbi:CU044_2847 family protein [Paractinoplanes brasiliensis]|uniref:Trypsin-co-occurring domain-containing protein n=1 Tax=Paractinoplanes brasiliensis TaxID=52695 RepID=A0A4R6JKU4_9ACTN|nr:CU044_2847 family protein [Actinoplanes brasiliensis]TDO36933.1 hypothetical protein C8E87_0523 [Actinoplanes brasiliensis]GID30455.1 hypothetical protein Abr02nite_54380 [Actinoplanes brasiliensis]